MTEEKNLEGLGGWLILVGLGIIISPLKITAQLFSFYSKIFSNGYWEALTTSGAEAYSPLWAPILIGEIIINVGLVFAWLYIAFLFFSKKKVFPKWFIGILVFTLAFIFVDALAKKAVLPSEPMFNLDTTKEFVRSFIAVLVWVPYMLMSKRVKAAFVK